MKKRQRRLKNWSISKPPKESPPKSKKWLKIFGFFLFVLLFFLGLTSSFWQVAKIECHLNGGHCSSETWGELMSLTGGKNILFLSSVKTSEKIRKDHSEFFQIEIRKKLPQTLVFQVEIRKAAVAISQEKDFYLVDEDGVLLEKKSENLNLPLLYFSGQVDQEVGTWLEDELLLKVIKLLYESKLRLLEPQSAEIISERVIELTLKNGLLVLFSSEKDLKEELDSLQFIFERSKIEGAKLKQVDLRFDKPVVLYFD